MGLRADAEVKTKISDIYQENSTGCFYDRFRYEINTQLVHVEDVLNKRGWDLQVMDVVQDSANLNMVVFGDHDQITAVNANLIREQQIRFYAHHLTILDSNRSLPCKVYGGICEEDNR